MAGGSRPQCLTSSPPKRGSRPMSGEARTPSGFPLAGMTASLVKAGAPPHIAATGGPACRCRPFRRRPPQRRKTSKRPLTAEIVLHIWRFTDGDRSLARPRLRLSQPLAGAPDHQGREMCRLFDIVGLDEGTCGRRPRSPRSSRPRRIGKVKPFYMSHYISTVYVMCRNGSLKPALEVRAIPRGRRWSDINLRV